MGTLLDRVGGWLSRVEPSPLLAVTHPAAVRAVLVPVLRAEPASFWRIDVRWTLRTLNTPLGQSIEPRSDPWVG